MTTSRPRKSRSPRKATTAVTDTEALAAARNRLRRANGQLEGVIRMLDEGSSCEQVVTQLSAVNKAIGAAAFTIISASLEQCLANRGRDQRETATNLQRLFLSLN